MIFIQQVLFFTMLLFLTTSHSISAQQQRQLLTKKLSETSAASLDLTQLPESLKREQKYRFEHLASSSVGLFNFYGNPDYGICNVDQIRMINHIALRATKDDCEFYILDIGAGDGSFGKSIYDYVNSGEFKYFLKRHEITENIKFHIVSVTGESMGSTIQVSENGIHYYVTKFMVEDLSKSIEEINDLDFSWGPRFGESFPFIHYLLDITKMKKEYNTYQNAVTLNVKKELLQTIRFFLDQYIEEEDQTLLTVEIDNLVEKYFSPEQKDEKERILKVVLNYMTDIKNQKNIQYYKEIVRKNIGKVRAMHNKIDWIVSSYCFIHLVDPLGMFKQGFDILRPQHGIMTIDDFAVSVKHKNIESTENIHSIEANRINLIKCLLKSGEPFIISRGRDYWHAMIKRSSEKKLFLPVKYTENGSFAKVRHTEGGSIATYEWTDSQPLPLAIRTYLKEAKVYSDVISGSTQEFYDEYKDIFNSAVIKWTSLNSDEDTDDLLSFRFIKPMTAEEDYLTIKESEWNRICLPYQVKNSEGILPSQNFWKSISPYQFYFDFRYADALSQRNFKEIVSILNDILIYLENKKIIIKRKISHFYNMILEKLDMLEIISKEDHALVIELQKDSAELIKLLHTEIENETAHRSYGEQETFEYDSRSKLRDIVNQLNRILIKNKLEIINWDNKKIELDNFFNALIIYKMNNREKAKEIKKIAELKKEYQALSILKKHIDIKEYNRLHGINYPDSELARLKKELFKGGLKQKKLEEALTN